MPTNKQKINISLKHFGLAVLLTILVLAGVTLLPKKQTANTSDEVQNSNEEEKVEQVKVEETIENGVYINHTYGFKFDYPETIFSNGSSYSGSTYWDNDPAVTSPFDLDENGVWLSTLVRQDSDPLRQQSEDIFESLYYKKESGDPRWIATEVEHKDFGDYKRVTYSFENSPDYEGEHGFAFHVQWKKESLPVIKLGFSAMSKTVLEKYEDEFRSVVDSFEFID